MALVQVHLEERSTFTGAVYGNGPRRPHSGCDGGDPQKSGAYRCYDGQVDRSRRETQQYVNAACRSADHISRMRFRVCRMRQSATHTQVGLAMLCHMQRGRSALVGGIGNERQMADVRADEDHCNDGKGSVHENAS